MKKITWLFFLAMMFSFSSRSFANPCEPDVKQYCSDVEPGGGRIMNCLQDHYKDVSQDCYDTLSKKMSGPGNGLMSSCKNDVKQYCSDVQPGGGRIINCLKDHTQEISQECHNSLDKMKPKNQDSSVNQPENAPSGPVILEACQDDAKQFCADTQASGSSTKDCLEDHFKDISQACYDAMAKSVS